MRDVQEKVAEAKMFLETGDVVTYTDENGEERYGVALHDAAPGDKLRIGVHGEFPTKMQGVAGLVNCYWNPLR